MWQSLRISHLLLRLCLAVVFLWSGTDLFFHQAFWLQGGLPSGLFHLLSFMRPETVGYMIGTLDLLVGISLISNMFADVFAALGLVLFISIMIAYGFNEAAIGYVGLLGGLLALMFWPQRQFRSF